MEVDHEMVRYNWNDIECIVNPKGLRVQRIDHIIAYFIYDILTEGPCGLARSSEQPRRP
jgi:hypothetical protein